MTFINERNYTGIQLDWQFSIRHAWENEIHSVLNLLHKEGESLVGNRH